MKEVITKYMQFLLDQMIKDAQYFDHWWMLTIVPAMFVLIYMIIKFTALTCLIWIPVIGVKVIISSTLRALTKPFRRRRPKIEPSNTIDSKV